MSQSAGFEIGVTPIAYAPADSYWRAFLVGLLNTLSVTIVGIALATLLGVIVGIAQLSSNWLIARMAQTYVAIFRNTPVLVQLFFWYLAVFLQLPRVQQAVALPGPIYLSNRGVAMIGLVGTASLGLWLAFIFGGLALAVGAWYALTRLQERTGRQSPRFLIGLLIVLFSAALGWLLAGTPLEASVPVRRGFNFQGGIQMVPEYAALLFGLVVYTGAFIAENVRAGIQGVSQGQKEAARALGLGAGQSMRLVILPQALRIIIPPTTSQYLNLAKNSSLAIAIGFPDLFNVARTISNQTGQVIQIIGLIMASYLAISLTTSLLMNLYNRRVRLVER
jgi:general L-amino acid transport system permease protein